MHNNAWSKVDNSSRDVFIELCQKHHQGKHFHPNSSLNGWTRWCYEQKNDSFGNVYKNLAIPGNVKSEDPCRIHFKLPKIHQPKNVLQIDLHIKVIINHFIRSMLTASLDFRCSRDGQEIYDVELAMLEDYSKKKIIAIKLIHIHKFLKINIASYIDFHTEHHQVEVWIGSKSTTSQIVCSNEDVERPIFIHYRREETKKIQIQQRSVLFINFSDLGWNNLILSPSCYEAGRCTGHCPSICGHNTY